MTQKNQPAVHPRLYLLWNAVYIACGLVAARLFQLQVVEHGRYLLEAEKNRSQIIYQAAPRGRLYDRNGALVATSRPSFSLMYLPGRPKTPEDLKVLADHLARQLDRDPADILESLSQADREQSVVRLAENLPLKTMFRLSEIKTLYPGVYLVVEARRYYPRGNFASHLIGTMGKIDVAHWRRLKAKGYRLDSWVGTTGLENIFENELRGEDGGIRMEVDAQGRLKRVLERVDWHTGDNVTLTLDENIQKAADQGLKDSATGRGAVVALDPQNGAILAIASAPSFDPNDLLSSDPQVVIAAAHGLPEFNRAISGTYAPGSTFKLIVGAAALNSGELSTDQSYYCPGYFDLGSKRFLCWDHKGHKRVSWLNAVAESCDVYFYHVGQKIGGGLIEHYEEMFGLGSKTHVALKGEASGHLFGPAQKRHSGRGWYDGDTVNLSIGQGELLATPIQMAVVAAAIANRGTLWRPHYTDHIDYADGRASFKQTSERLGTVVLGDQTWDDIQEAMRLVVSSGTGVSAQIPGLDVRGKTGTSQIDLGKDHAWFIAYAAEPGEAPRIAVAVLVENGGHGGVAAVPIARKVILAALGPEARL